MKWIPVNSALGEESKGYWVCKGVDRSCHVQWLRSFADLKPVLNADNLPTFILISSQGRMEIQSLDIPFIENQAKKFTQPRGRGKHSQDVCRIYIKTEDNQEVLIGKATHSVDREYKHVGPWDDEEGNSDTRYGTYGTSGVGGDAYAQHSNPNMRKGRYNDDGKGTGGWVRL